LSSWSWRASSAGGRLERAIAEATAGASGPRQKVEDGLRAYFAFVADHLEGKQYLMGDAFTVADAYLFTVTNWGQFVGVDIGQWPALKAHHARVAARPKVQEALKAEGLIK
jgi:glutathione S-transferase